jgi:hypothetical protein
MNSRAVHIQGLRSSRREREMSNLETIHLAVYRHLGHLIAADCPLADSQRVLNRLRSLNFMRRILCVRRDWYFWKAVTAKYQSRLTHNLLADFFTASPVFMSPVFTKIRLAEIGL